MSSPAGAASNQTTNWVTSSSIAAGESYHVQMIIFVKPMGYFCIGHDSWDAQFHDPGLSH